MATRKPLVLVGGRIKELPAGDVVDVPPEGGGGAAWTTVSADGEMVAAVPERVTAAVTRDLPATIAANDLFTLHAQGGDVIIATPHTIKRGASTICVPSDTLTVAQGETVYLLANSISELGII